MEFPGEGAGQVEAEPVHVHLEDPVAETVHDELENLGMAHVQGVAASGVVHVEAGLLLHQPVVGRVVDSPERQGGTQVVSLAGVVVDHVEDDFDARVVEGTDHHLEFVRGGHGSRTVPVVRGKIGQGVVPPVVGEALGDEGVFAGMVVDRKKLDCGDSQGAEIVDDRFAGKPRVRSAKLRRKVRVEGGETLDVGFVDDRFRPGRAGRAVGPPDVGGIRHHRQGGSRRIVPGVSDHILPGIAQGIGEHRVVPADAPGDLLGIGVEQDLFGVEAESPGRIVGPMDPVAVDPSGPGLREVEVPDVVGPLGEGKAHRFGRGLAVGKKTELDPFGVFGEEGEVDPLPVPGGPEGKGFSGQGSHGDPFLPEEALFRERGFRPAESGEDLSPAFETGSSPVSPSLRWG